MGQLLLLLVVALTVAAVVFGVTVLVTGNDPGLGHAEPDARAVPLPGSRPLLEADVADVRFDTAARGYRMTQVDQALRRAAYDIGYKHELIEVLEAEVVALREGRTAEAEELRRAREAALGATGGTVAAAETVETGGVDRPPAEAASPGAEDGATAEEQAGVAVVSATNGGASPAVPDPADPHGSAEAPDRVERA